EAHARSEPSWPCGVAPVRAPRWHEVDFHTASLGARLPPEARFPNAPATLHWLDAAPVGADRAVGTPARVARVLLWEGDAAAGRGIFAAVFHELALRTEIETEWKEGKLGILVARALRGLTVLSEERVPLSLPASLLALDTPAGATSVELWLENDAGGRSQD